MVTCTFLLFVLIVEDRWFFTSVLELVNSFNLGTVNPVVSGILTFISLKASCLHFPALRMKLSFNLMTSLRGLGPVLCHLLNLRFEDTLSQN